MVFQLNSYVVTQAINWRDCREDGKRIRQESFGNAPTYLGNYKVNVFKK